MRPEKDEKVQNNIFTWLSKQFLLKIVQKSSLNTIQARIVIATNHQFHLKIISKHKIICHPINNVYSWIDSPSRVPVTVKTPTNKKIIISAILASI